MLLWLFFIVLPVHEGDGLVLSCAAPARPSGRCGVRREKPVQDGASRSLDGCGPSGSSPNSPGGEIGFWSGCVSVPPWTETQGFKGANAFPQEAMPPFGSRAALSGNRSFRSRVVKGDFRQRKFYNTDRSLLSRGESLPRVHHGGRIIKGSRLLKCAEPGRLLETSGASR